MMAVDVVVADKTDSMFKRVTEQTTADYDSNLQQSYDRQSPGGGGVGDLKPSGGGQKTSSGGGGGGGGGSPSTGGVVHPGSKPSASGGGGGGGGHRPPQSPSSPSGGGNAQPPSAGDDRHGTTKMITKCSMAPIVHDGDTVVKFGRICFQVQVPTIVNDR